MELKQERRDGVLIMTPVGRIDSNAAGELEPQVLSSLEGEPRLIFDLGCVDYISSAGLRLLLMVAKRLKSAEGQLVLCSFNESVKQVFELAGFQVLFAVEDDAARALERLTGQD